MKISNMGIIFSIIFLCFVVKTDLREQLLVAITNQKVRLDQQFDNAIDDSITRLVELDETDTIKINKEVAMEQFYKSLSANLGILDNPAKQQLLPLYVPVTLITDIDGFYINYNAVDDGVLKDIWTDKIPYSYQENGLIYRFFLGQQKDDVTILNIETNELKEGHYKELLNEYPNSEILNNFDEYRRKIIIHCITEKMKLYINKHNHIASQYGITYTFALPTISDDDWNRTIDDISMMILFQGYQYGTSRTMVYNRYTISGARLRKSQLFYIQEYNGKKYYHKEDCELLTDKSDVYKTKEECAKEGAFECPICKP